MAFTEELTSEQIDQIPIYRQTWQDIALLTDRINSQEATTAVQDTYELLGMKSPEICFFESPYAAANAAKNLYQSLSFSQDGLAHATKFIDKLHHKFYTENIEAIGHWDAWVESQLELNASSEIDTQLSTSLKNYFLGSGSQDWYQVFGLLPLSLYIHKSAFFDFHFSVAKQTLFQPHDELAWEVFKKLARSCGWIIPFEEICFVSERPTQFLFDSENRLHAEGEAAVKFTDGSGLYSYYGVTLPERYGKQNFNQWQPCWLLEEFDTQLKQVLVQAITADSNDGKNRYFSEALEIAASLGRHEIVKYILENEKKSCRNLSNALAHGIWSRDIKILETLINAGACINIRTEWGTPLIAAVRTGDIRLVSYLVEAGGNPNMWIDNDGYSSPLSQAVDEGHQEICDYLLPLITDPEEIKYAQQELPKAIIRKQRKQNQQLQ